MMVCAMIAGTAAGCSSSKGTTSAPTAGLVDSSSVPTTVSDTVDYGTDVTAAPADNTGDTSSAPAATAAPATEAPTAAPTPTPEPPPTPEPTPTPTPAPTYKGSLEIPSDITDPIDRLEYIRSQLIANKDYYDSLDNYNNQTWCFKRMKDHSQSGSY